MHSELGQGSRFRIYLPSVETKLKQETDPVKPPPMGSERILFVDDEPTIVAMAGRMLENLGYKVVSRTSSLDALELFRAGPNDVDLIITDMTMPGMTGVEFAAEIRKIRSNIPMMICTGFKELKEGDRFAALGIGEVVMKPILKREMAEAIRRVLNRAAVS